MKKLSVTIITKNEEENIKRCLASVTWADEIVVVDSGSTDKTVEICEKYGCKVIQTEWWGFGKTKQFAVNSATYDWIFSIDADEEVTPELAKKIQKLLSQSSLKSGYKVKRQSFYVKQWIRYCGWDRDYPLRLFNRKQGNFNDKLVHESVEIDGDVGKIEKTLKHYTYPNLKSHIDKINKYSDLGAKSLFEKGKQSSIFNALFHSFSKFIKMYVIQKGFLDGKIGFILSYNSAFGVWLKYLKLWEKNNSDQKK
jgi:glycosyltransferase involved in cell wall biosynthesis